MSKIETQLMLTSSDGLQCTVMVLANGQLVIEADETEYRVALAKLGLKYSATRPASVPIWDAINEYAAACGGDTSNATISDRRMDAVAAVERILS